MLPVAWTPSVGIPRAHTAPCARLSPQNNIPLPRGWACHGRGGGTTVRLREPSLRSDAMGRGVGRRSPFRVHRADGRRSAPQTRQIGGIRSQERGPKCACVRAHPAMQGGSIHSLTETPSRTRPHRVVCRAVHGSESVRRRMYWHETVLSGGLAVGRRGRASPDACFGGSLPCGAPVHGAPHGKAIRGDQEQPMELPQFMQR